MDESKTSAPQDTSLFAGSLKKCRENPWIISSFILAILLAAALLFPGVLTGNAVSDTEAGELMETYLNSLVGGGVSVIDVQESGSLYEIIASYKGQEIPVYMTKDGEYFVQGAEKIGFADTLTGNTVNSGGAAGSQKEEGVPKADEPAVELFVMTHCPYGTQAEKGMVPVLKLLNGKIDGTIRFVHYFMHGEEEEQETYRQVCIREEQGEKYLAYLECFLESSDSESCLAKSGVNKAKVENCVGDGHAKAYYEEDSELSQGYGVQGSPTLIINGVESGAGRSPASYLSGICDAFNNAPSECSEQLSSANPSPGFGSGTAATGTAAQCG